MNRHALRVAVTRDEGPDGPLSVALRRRGLEPFACPAVREVAPPDLEALRRAVLDLEHYDWLVVASQRAVAAIRRLRGGCPFPATLRTATVGASTAARLVECGARAPLVAACPGATALVDVLESADTWTGRQVLLLRALEGGRAVTHTLRRHGAVVVEVVAYATRERECRDLASDWSHARPDAVAVASPSAARALVRALGADALQRLHTVAALGPTTAAALATLGVSAVVPADADFDALAEVIERRARTGETQR